MLAAWTHRIEFGAMVSPVTFRQPGLLASMAVAINELSQGRVVVGLGAGWNQTEHDRFGIPFPNTRDRLDALASGLPLITRLFEDLGSHRFRKPPILIGGNGRQRTLRIAAQFANEWNGFGLTPDQYAERIQMLADYCSQIDRDPRDVSKSLLAGVILGRDDADLRERIIRLGHIFPELAEAEPARVLADIRATSPGRWFVGSPREIVDQIALYSSSGVDRVILQHGLLDDPEILEVLASEVLPHFDSPNTA